MNTVDYGIDLGTTNSAVAHLRGVETEVLKNNDDQDTTASAVWIDRRGRLLVGRAARERAEFDPDNTCLEFKLRMGLAGPAKRFAATGRELTAEELSAEVLRSLRGDVRQRHGVEIDAAVITVPAAFDLAACEATRTAARMAGLTFAPLLQEPTAAALAFGFQREEDSRFLVYDLGGGTFDAAVVQVRDGEFSVLTHQGDTYLGGKLIDWRIVEELLLPRVAAEFHHTDLNRGNPRWARTVGRLKLAAEAAKIRLSRAGSTDVLVEIDGADGQREEFETELTRADVERLAEPFVVRSVNLCRRALAEAGLGPGDLARVLLVGGPTLAPYLRERLADPEHGLGAPIDHSQDPLTVVARGAAVFAGTQRRPETGAPALVAGEPGTPAGSGGFAIRLEYPRVGPDTEPLVTGRVSGADDLTGYHVELVNTQARPPWRSGRIALAADGIFGAVAWAARGTVNAYRIELTDPTGAAVPVEPDSFEYTVGVVETNPPLTHSIGVGLADEEMLWLVRKGAPLPVKVRHRLRTTEPVRRGQSSGMILIPLLEGEHTRADRNRRIGTLTVAAAQVSRDVPEGSEIQLRVTIDASRAVTASAYVPLLDEEFDHVVTLRAEEVPTHEVLAAAVDAERRRLAEVRGRQQARRDIQAEAILSQIEAERAEDDLTALADAARSDTDAATACANRLLDLRAAVDAAEAALDWPEQTAQAEDLVTAGYQLAELTGPDAVRRMAELAAGVRTAVETIDARLLGLRVEEIKLFLVDLLRESGELDRLQFEELTRRRPDMRDPALADQLIATGRSAAARGDRYELNTVNVRLAGLLPEPPPAPDPFSTVRRG